MKGRRANKLLNRLVSTSEMFDLTRDNALEFLASFNPRFNGREIDAYVKSEEGLWVPEKGHKTLRVIDSRVVGNRSVEIGISCDEGRRKTEERRVYDIDFNNAPRFAFLNLKTSEQTYKGLFYSQGKFVNRYGEREQRVFLLR